MLAQDPYSSDLEFTDADLPAIGAGYFYLVAIVDNAGDEFYLGTTSAGVERQVAVPCP